MSVSNGEIANQTTFNDAFMSRDSDTSTVGKVDLLNTGSATITDVQLVINNILVDLANAETDIDNLETSRVFRASSSTDNALARFDGTDGNLIQNSLVTVTDTGSMTVPEDLLVQGNLTVEGTLTSVNSTDLEVEDKNITINKGGTDITAEGAGLTVERTGVDGSIVYEDALPSKFKAGPLGSEVELANVSSAQVFTNKDIDGGTAANNRRITLPKDTLANLTALTRKAGTVVYATDTQKFYYDDGTTLVDPGAGASAAIDQTVGSADAGKLIKTGSDGFLDESFNVKEPSFASESAFTTFLGRASQTGDRYFNTTDKKFYVYDGTAFIVASGSGSGGVVNLITNGNADDAVASIFTPYEDAAGTRPVDGTGGSPTVTTAITTTAPLNGTKSFLLTKPASNVQGQGWSILSFTVDPAYRAKVLSISVDYIVNSGTFTAGTGTTDGDVIWYIYDVTNAQLIEPSSIKMFSNSSTISDRFESTFQTSATGSTYRLIAHVASTSASAFELKVDNVTVSPSQYIYGTPITDWQTYTPTGTFTTNTTYSGVWRRVGDSLEGQVRLTFAGAPNAVTLTGISIPSGLVIDTTTKAINSVCGIGSIFDNGVNRYSTDVYISSTTTVNPQIKNTAGTFATIASISNTSPFTIGSTDTIEVSFFVPIVGWSSSVQMSDSADTRVVAAVFSGSTTSITSAGSVIVPTTVLSDTHGAFSGSTFTVPASGFYDFSGTIRFTNAVYAVGDAVSLFVRINGATDYLLGQYRITSTANLNYSTSGSFSLSLTIGNTVQFLAVSNVTNTLSGANGFYGSIRRVSGPQAIAASEKIRAKYRTTAGQSISNVANTIVDYGTKVYDSHNAVTTGGSWRFTAPTEGVYKIIAMNTFASAAYAANNGISIQVFKNGTIEDLIAYVIQQTAITAPFAAYGETSINLLAGEFIDVRINNARTAGTTNLNTTASQNYVVIEKE